MVKNKEFNVNQLSDIQKAFDVLVNISDNHDERLVYATKVLFDILKEHNYQEVVSRHE